MQELTPTVNRFGLSIDKQKQDGLAMADAQGNGFMSLFTTFGTFSIVAGILLIFLLFVMLAAERRGELGIARAVGTRRGHLVEMYLFEGLAYDLIAAVVGVVLGVAVALGMVFAIARAVASFGFDVTFHVTVQSLVLAYSIGRAADADRGEPVGVAREPAQHHAPQSATCPTPGAQGRRAAGSWSSSASCWRADARSPAVSAANATSFLLGFSLT